MGVGGGRIGRQGVGGEARERRLSERRRLRTGSRIRAGGKENDKKEGRLEF